MSKWSSITALVAPGHEDEMLDPGLARLVDHVLHDRAVDDGQHLLRHGLGGGQEAGAETGDGEDGFADALHRAFGDRDEGGGGRRRRRDVNG